MVPAPPTPRTVRPVVSGAYGCKSNFICKVRWGVSLVSSQGQQEDMVGTGLCSYAEDYSLWVPGDPQGAMGGRGEAAWLTKMMASCWASILP